MQKRTLFFVTLLILTVLEVSLCCYYLQRKAKHDVYNAMEEDILTEVEACIEEAMGSETFDESADNIENPVNFEKLWEMNPDIYAWIYIPGTKINYPIVQHSEDDGYYLNHTVEQREGLPGSIYTQLVSKKDFSMFDTVIYGHNMKDGTMFGSLKENTDIEYLKEHDEIIIYLPDQVYRYKIFAAVVYDDRLITSYYDEEKDTDRQAFLSSIYDISNKNSNILKNVKVTTESHLLTLSTCIRYHSDQRYLVEAVLTNEEEQ